MIFILLLGKSMYDLRQGCPCSTDESNSSSNCDDAVLGNHESLFKPTCSVPVGTGLD